ncbi:hypothetical protein C9439_07695 [archaeon SCG-AAA382B04]|nr:hypothetical protein C9439_07695 [archaeon SCG-AAA382B04]
MQNHGEAKYLIHAQIQANGVVEKPDVVGAIFGQTEGLIGEKSDLRELQKGGRVGRIKVNIDSDNGQSKGEVLIPSSLNKVETAVLAASLETIDRIGPCKANIGVTDVEDVRESKRDKIVDRAKEILENMFAEDDMDSREISKTVKRSFGESAITSHKGLNAGPNVESSDAILLVEGRSDVLNLLDNGIKNSIAIEGTDMPDQIEELCKQKKVTAFLDGDRGGDLILKELTQRADIDNVARAPEGKQVEELNHEEIKRLLKEKVPVEKSEEIKKRNQKTEKQRVKTAESNKEKSKILQKAKKGLKRRVSKKQKPEPSKDTEETQEKDQQKTESTETQKKQKDYQKYLNELEGTLKAKLLDKNKEEIEEIPVRELTNRIKKSKNTIHTIIFDGVTTQRLLDVSSDNNVKRLVGIKKGSIAKKPTDVEIISKKELS